MGCVAVKSTNITVAFPATLNFMVYMLSIRSNAKDTVYVDNTALTPFWQEPINNDRITPVWNELLTDIKQNGVANQDGRCLADPGFFFRSLFAPNCNGQSEFFMAWVSFFAWWSHVRTAYDYAIEAFTSTLDVNYRLQLELDSILLIYDAPPSGCSTQLDNIMVLPFEHLILIR
jgi:hypothetical protein